MQISTELDASRSHEAIAPIDCLSVVETFHSIQGEGFWVGCNAFFIRLAGCDVGCSWCDTKHSWPMHRHPQQGIAALVAKAQSAAPQFVVVTGGEPLLHDLTALTEQLHQSGLRIHLETAGVYPLSGQFDWITLSPKPHRPPCAEIFAQVNELKIVIVQASDLLWAEQQAACVSPETVKLLQPEWHTPESQQLIFDYVLHHPKWRISLQTHKFLGVR
jgi:organic radical activating enzyme